jgi:hypothetical protein
VNTAKATINRTIESEPFNADGDNAPILNAFLDSIPEEAVVTLPPGVWPIDSAVIIKKRLTIGPTENLPATLRLNDADVLSVATDQPVPAGDAALVLGVATAKATISKTMESQPLTTDGDNAPILNAFLDSVPEGATVTLPPGIWPTHSTVIINKRITLESAENASATIRLIATNQDADVLSVATYQTAPVHGVTVRKLTLEVVGEMLKGQIQCLEVNGDDFTAENVTLIGCPHEGSIVHGHCKNARLTDCVAIRCGLGNEFYGLPLAGFNSHAYATVYTRCKAINCGQGYEVDGHHTKVLYGEVEMDGTVTTWDGKPLWGGINIGSATFGLWDVEIAYCRVKGGCSFGNGNGRLASMHIHDNVLYGNARTSAMGGMFNNKGGPVPNPNPDTGHSIVERNVYIYTGDDNHVIGVGTGPAAGTWDHDGNPETPPYQEQGREPITFQDNVLIYAGPLNGPNSSPIMYIAGTYSAPVKFLRNKLYGFDAAPSRGDLATFSNNQSVAIPGQPNLIHEGNVVIKRDGTMRPLVVKIEGAA